MGKGQPQGVACVSMSPSLCVFFIFFIFFIYINEKKQDDRAKEGDYNYQVKIYEFHILLSFLSVEFLYMMPDPSNNSMVFRVGF